MGIGIYFVSEFTHENLIGQFTFTSVYPLTVNEKKQSLKSCKIRMATQCTCEHKNRVYLPIFTYATRKVQICEAVFLDEFLAQQVDQMN